MLMPMQQRSVFFVFPILNDISEVFACKNEVSFFWFLGNFLDTILDTCLKPEGIKCVLSLSRKKILDAVNRVPPTKHCSV